MHTFQMGEFGRPFASRPGLAGSPPFQSMSSCSVRHLATFVSHHILDSAHHAGHPLLVLIFARVHQIALQLQLLEEGAFECIDATRTASADRIAPTGKFL